EACIGIGDLSRTYPRPRRATQRLRRLAEGANEGAPHPLGTRKSVVFATRSIRARLEKLERSAPAEITRCGEIVRSIPGAADREQSQGCGSLLAACYQGRVTAACLPSSESAHRRPQAWPASHPLRTQLLHPSWRAIALRRSQSLTVPAPASLEPASVR